MNASIKILLIAILTIAGVSRLATVVMARSSPVTAQSHDHSANNHSAKVGDGDGETNDDASPLQALAKITPDQAQQAAETLMGKRADRVELENDEGNLVYAVSFGQQDVKIDAGNGTALYTDNQRDEQPQATHPRSSIQVPKSLEDGETNDDS